MKEIFAYCDETGAAPVIEFLKKADSKIHTKLSYQINVIKCAGQLACEPHIKHFTIERYKQFYEFRIKTTGKIVRIIFCEYGESIVLLHAFYKKDKRDTEQALNYTLKLVTDFDISNCRPFKEFYEVMKI